MFEWGSYPEIRTATTVDENYVFRKGDGGRLQGGKITLPWIIPYMYPDVPDSQTAEFFRAKMKDSDANVIYIKVSHEDTFLARIFTIEDCVFVGTSPNSFTAAGIATILIISALATVIIAWTVVGSWAAVKFVDATSGFGGIIIVVLVMGFVLLLFGVGFKGKSKDKEVVAGKT